MKKTFQFLIIIGLLIITAVFGWNWYQAERLAPGAIHASGGAAMNLLLKKSTTHFSQKDPRWAQEKIGGSGETIRAVGCTLCSVAMAVTDLGHAINPAELNSNMIGNGGYTERGWMIWGAVTPSTSDFAEVVVYQSPSHARIDEALKRGEIPIVKFFLPGGIPHWVPVVGKTGEEYLVNDPAMLKSPSGPVKLSDRARSIHSLRVVRKKA